MWHVHMTSCEHVALLFDRASSPVSCACISTFLDVAFAYSLCFLFCLKLDGNKSSLNSRQGPKILVYKWFPHRDGSPLLEERPFHATERKQYPETNNPMRRCIWEQRWKFCAGNYPVLAATEASGICRLQQPSCNRNTHVCKSKRGRNSRHPCRTSFRSHQFWKLPMLKQFIATVVFFISKSSKLY